MTAPLSPHGWMPIETAPKDGAIVLVAGRYVDHPTTARFDKMYRGAPYYVGMADGRLAIESQSDFGTSYIEIMPDVWQPLPEYQVQP